MVPNFHQNTMFLDKADYFSNKSLDAYKNADFHFQLKFSYNQVKSLKIDFQKTMACFWYLNRTYLCQFLGI